MSFILYSFWYNKVVVKSHNGVLQNKKLIVFDLDGTLTSSKLPMDKEMAGLLCRLVQKKLVAIIGGGKYGQFQTQFLKAFRCPKQYLKNLFLFPTNSTAGYFYRGGWKLMYQEKLSAKEKKKIRAAFKKSFLETRYRRPSRVYGQVIEDRGSQITFSALGQKAPLKLKVKWNKRQDVRSKLMKALRKHIPEFEVRSGGLTSIDVTRKGIDKAYGMRQIMKHLHVSKKDTLFVGDAIYPGGNDYAAIKTGVDYVKISGPKEAKKIIKLLLEQS